MAGQRQGMLSFIEMSKADGLLKQAAGAALLLTDAELLGQYLEDNQDTCLIGDFAVRVNAEQLQLLGTWCHSTRWRSTMAKRLPCCNRPLPRSATLYSCGSTLILPSCAASVSACWWHRNQRRALAINLTLISWQLCTGRPAVCRG